MYPMNLAEVELSKSEKQIEKRVEIAMRRFMVAPVPTKTVLNCHQGLGIIQKLAYLPHSERISITPSSVS